MTTPDDATPETPAETQAETPAVTKDAHAGEPKPLDSAAAPGKNATKVRGKPFAKGNSGRPKGARNKTSIAVESLLDGEADKLTRKAIKLALAGDATAMKLCMDRIAPVRKGRRVQFALPPIKTTADVLVALAAITTAVSCGQLSPAEGLEVAGVVELSRRAIEQQELEVRIRTMEERFK